MSEKLGIKIFFIILIFLIIFLFSLMIDLRHADAVNKYFSAQYESKIKPESEEQISKIVSKISSINNTTLKINEIANWTVTNFKNCYWNPELCWKDPLTGSAGWKPIEITQTYWRDKQGNIRVRKGAFLNDPYWIAYYRAGACGELASLFSEIANRSDLKVQIASSGDPKFNHEWNEVKIDNKWKYVDLTIYWNYWKGDSNSSYKWFNETKYFQCNCYNVTKIVVINTDEDVSVRYPYLC